MFNKEHQTKCHLFTPYNDEYEWIQSPLPFSKVDSDCKHRLFVHHMSAGQNQILV